MKKILAASLLLTGQLLHAQDDTTARPLNEVIVTANKMLQKQSTTGKVISVITKEQIERSNGRTLAQLLNEQASITINGALNNLGSNQTLYMRGAASGRTLVLLDGIPVYDPSLINNEFDLNLIALNQVESVEICRGAQSTLYGSDAVAGVVNIITVKKDVTKPFNLNASQSVGSYGTYRGNAQLFGRAGKFTYSTRYTKTVSDGFSAAQDATGNKNFDNDGYNGDVANAAVQYAASPAWSFRSFVQYSRYRTDLDASAFTDERDFSINNKSAMAGAGFRYQKNRIALTGNYQYSDIRRNYLNDSLHVPGFSKFSSDDYYGKGQFAELYANIALGRGFTLLQGVDYRRSSMNSQFLSISSFGPYSSAFNDTSQNQSSVYTSVLYNAPGGKLNVELGGRLNFHSEYGRNHTFTFNPSYNFSDHFRLFGSIATGFKAPTLYHLYSSYGRPDLQPEKSITYEVGAQQMSNRVSNRLVFFHREIDNGIDYDNIRFKYYNYITQTVNGVELESSVKLTEGLTLIGNYTYLNPQETAQSRLTTKDTTYQYLLRRPAHSANLTASYAFGNGLLLSTSGKYVSSRYDVGGYRVPDVQLKGYFLLNAYAEYKLTEQIKLFADAQNIFNEKFVEVRGYNSIPFLLNGGIILKL